MTDTPDLTGNATAKAAGELIQLEKQTEKARVLLARLQEGLVHAGNQLGGEAVLLIEANQQLVLSALRAQTHAETSARSAEQDTLTGLPNRTVLLDRLAQAIIIAKRRGTCLGLLFLDLNGFKHINDTLGHAIGDEVLLRVAQCLTAVVRKADTVSRHGGDEFLILLAEVAHTTDAMLIADKIHAALITPHRLGEHAFALTASIGISLFPDHGEEPDVLIEHADLAMYHAKRNGLGSYVYHEEMAASPLEQTASGSNPPSNPLALSDRDARHAYLREANERLIIAALSAQDLQAAAEQAQLRQTEFLAVLAHELRNPLAPIRMAAALMGRVDTDAEQLQELKLIIERQVVRMARLLDDLFDVARVNSGKLSIEHQLVDMVTLLNEAIEAYTPLMHKRRQQFTIQIPAGGTVVNGDPVRLAQVLSNLLDNACKYTPEGGEITLKAVIQRAKLVMTFSDTGIGIAASALPHIFEPFMQDSAATGFNNEGLGIGLTVVRELVEAHEGSVTAHSKGHGLGSQFVVTLPLFGGRQVDNQGQSSGSLSTP